MERLLSEQSIVGSTTAAEKWSRDMAQLFQRYLDKSVPHSTARWIGTLVFSCLYALRVYHLEGFYIVTYGLGIYIINLLMGFLTPQMDLDGTPSLPTRGSDEFKPFVRKLPEFKFWYALTRAFVVAFAMTFFFIFDIPVFWPILVVYWVVLFATTMGKQVQHMIKHKYIPFSIGKQRYSGKKQPKSTKD